MSEIVSAVVDRKEFKITKKEPIYEYTYSAKITIAGQVKYLGIFETAYEAHQAYMREAKENGIVVKNNGISTVSISGYIGVNVTMYEKREHKPWGSPRVFRKDQAVKIESVEYPLNLKPKKNTRQHRCARSDNASGLKGAMQTGTGKWMSRIWTGSDYKYLGYFHSAEEAHEAYVRASHGGKNDIYKNVELLPEHKDHSFVYVVKYDEKYFKIGVAKDPIERLATIATCLPLPPSLLTSMYSEDAYLIERKLHKQFSSKRLNGEWFLLNQEDLDYIVSIADSLHPRK
jgi:hypothetical protein